MKSKSQKYVIIRGDRSGVFAGTLVSRKGREVVLNGVRRLWYWSGAASLSQLAVDGVSRPDRCKFPVEVAQIEILDALEVIDCSDVARASIAAVPVWKS